MSCYMYWDRIKSISRSLKKYEGFKLCDIPLDEIIPLLDSIEEIAHDNIIDFDSTKHILDDEKMNKSLQIIRKFYINLGARLETEKAEEILKSDNQWATLESFHFYNRYQGLINNENQLVKFAKGQNLAFIGGGPLPLTSILLNKYYGINM